MGNEAHEHDQEALPNAVGGTRDVERPADAPHHFDVDAFLTGLDAIFDAHKAATDAEPYLQQALVDAENAGDDAGLLTVLNEAMGFYRSQGRHADNQWIIQRALELGLRMRIEGTEAWTTTLINAATGMRAAGQYEQSEELYRQALESAQRTMPATDRRMAALHNNLSMLYSETGRMSLAQRELETALEILSATSVDVQTDLDVASTHTNLALVMLQRATAGTTSAKTKAAPSSADSRDDHESLLAQARTHAAEALNIYRAGRLEHSAHYASALAGYAQVCYTDGRFKEAVASYRHALSVIAECYGKDTEYYRTTEHNLRDAESGLALAQRNESGTSGTIPVNAEDTLDMPTPTTVVASVASSASATGVAITRESTQSVQSTQTTQTTESQHADSWSGLQLARAYWEHYGKPLVHDRYSEYSGRIAAGLVGHGSECYGFDDRLSHDHDFGPGFCLWLTDEDYEVIGQQLQADYDALPSTFMGQGPRQATARAQGAGQRVGVFRIGDFFASITGYRQAPPSTKPHEWLLLDEATLAAATNGEIFADPFGAMLKTRQGFKMMPDDVRLALISRRLGMIGQAGQYNLPRMLARDDGAAAWRSINECVEAMTSLVFLINTPITAGYMPYYKWQFAALRRLSGRIATRLSDVCAQLEHVLRLSSAACFGGAGFGEGGKGSAPAQRDIAATIEHICGEIVEELHREHLSDSTETFLEWQRPYVEEHIASDDPALHSL